MGYLFSKGTNVSGDISQTVKSSQKRQMLFLLCPAGGVQVASSDQRCHFQMNLILLDLL